MSASYFASRSFVTKLYGFVILAVSAAGCGGGGGGGGGATPQAPTPPVNTAPIANAGADANAFKRVAVTLDGSASSDAENNALTYAWTQTSGDTVTLSSSTVASPTFTPSTSGSYTFSLTVNDGRASSAADTVTITVVDRIPTASAGTNANARYGATVTLDGRGSNDPDNDTLTYTWTQINGPTVALNLANPSQPTFVAPSISIAITFRLVVSDGELTSGNSEVVVSISSTGTNSAPVVDAGVAQTRPRRSTVSLSGYAYDPDNQTLQVRWRQLTGPTVTLSSTTAMSPQFTAPSTPATLDFELSATDGVLPPVVDTVRITIQNFAPTITATLSPVSPKAGDPLVGSATTTDADLDTVTLQYSWTKNGATIAGQTGATLPVGNYVKNDVIVLTVVANDGTTTASRTLTATIVDSPPVFTATPPTSVNYGGLVSFHITGTDADGEAINYVLRHGPNGMTVNSNGDVSWTAKLPMFDTELDVDWGIGTTSTTATVLSGTIKVTDSARNYPLARGGLQTSNLHHGTVVTDLDGDGKDEMLIGSGRMLYEFGRVGTTYAQRWLYPFSIGKSDITSIAAADITGDGKKEIFVSTGDVTVQLDGATRRIVKTFSVGANRFCRDLVVADLTNDGIKELVCSSTGTNYTYKSRITVLTLPSGSSAFNSPEFDGNLDVAVGNVDGDSALEIVFSNGYVYDGSTFANEWASSSSFGQNLMLADVNGDGVKEVVGTNNSGALTVWSVVSRSILWQPTLPNYYSGYTYGIVDVEGDGVDEIVGMGSGYSNSIAAYHRNVTTGATETVFDVTTGVSQMPSFATTGDVNNDGTRELVMTMGYGSSSVAYYMGMTLTATPTVVWNLDATDEPRGAFSGGQFAETSIGQKKLIFGSNSSGYSGYSRIVSLDAASGLYTKSTTVGSTYSSRVPIDLVDYDGDGIEEAFTNGYNSGYASFIAYDVNSSTTEWQSPAQNGSVSSVAHGDFNADGRADFVGATSDGYVSIFDAVGQTLIWKSDALTSVIDVAVADLDNDGPLEVIVLCTNKLYVFEQTSGPVKMRERASVTGPQYSSIYVDIVVGDTDGDGKPEIFLLKSDTTPYTITKYGPTLNQLATFNAPANARVIEIENLNAARKNLIVAVTDQYYYSNVPASFTAIDATNGTKVWKSPDFSGQSQSNSFYYVDTNNDGEKEISFATSTMMYLTR